MINKELIVKRFEKSLDSYESSAIIQREMAKTLVDLTLKFVCKDKVDDILELGCGIGFVSRDLVERIECKNYYVNDIVDLSDRFREKPYHFLCGDCEKIDKFEQVDIVVSNAMMQWVSNFENLLYKLNRCIRGNGLLVFTTFFPDNYKQIRSTLDISLKYLDFEENMSILSKNFEVLYTKREEREIEFDTILSLFRHIKATGVNCVEEGKSLTKGEINAVRECILREYGRLILTYSYGFFVCRSK